ncbi:MAG: hypothetical protein IT184_09990 [Acidobacteria bacterium]|nr:hypothetical protein [Acidobacteriota bacterium]
MSDVSMVDVKELTVQWSEVIKPPAKKTLREFAALWLVVFLAMAGWRWFKGSHDGWTIGLAVAAVVVGAAGLARPALVRPIFTGWMIAAFPIGWTVSRIALGAIFFLVLTPLAWVFRAAGRDVLRLRRPRAASYWQPKPQAARLAEYLRQS